ncbi:MAG: YDG domain-containing protein, partial [Burkholderiales bacterium]|nr:YDG domain-containing protein [Burkholderiales bacterium]
TVADGNGGANYAVSFVADTTGVITPRALTVSAQSDTKVYDGTTSSAVAPQITAGSLVGGDSASFSQVFDNRNAGTGKTLTASGTVADGNGGANYAVSFVADTTGVITPASLAIAANNASRPYGDPNPPLSATFTGLAAGDTPADIAGLTITTPAVPASNVGLYAITPGGGINPNYNISYIPGTLTIVPAPLTITADDATRAQFAPNPPFAATASGFRLGQGFGNLAGTLSFFTPATPPSPPGAYPIVPSGVSSPNYAVLFVNGTLFVTAATPPQPPVVPPAGAMPIDDQAYIVGLQRGARSVTDEGRREGRGPGRALECIELERRDGERRVLFTCY